MARKYKAPVDKETIDSAEGALRNQYYLPNTGNHHKSDHRMSKHNL